MTYLRTLLILTLLLVGAASCNKNEIEVPEPPTVDLTKVYTATNQYSGSIYMATNRGWISDSAVVKGFIDRLKASDEQYPFGRIKADTDPMVQQKVSFSGDTAFFERDSKTAAFTHDVLQTSTNTILWLIAKSDTTYEAKKKPETIIQSLGFYSPETYTTAALDQVTEAADIKVTTKPKHSFVVGEGQLQAPGIIYYLKIGKELKYSGRKNNFLSETFFSGLAAGDTVLIQGYRVDFK